MLKCNICGFEFNAIIEKHYIPRDNTKAGLYAIVGGDEPDEYDTFDCPQCGCQHVAQKRKRAVKSDD